MENRRQQLQLLLNSRKYEKTYKRTSSKACNHCSRISDRIEDGGVVSLVESWFIGCVEPAKPILGYVGEGIEASDTVA